MDWYAVLAVEQSASADQIRKAYYKAALKYHPDKNSGEDAAQQFNNARQAFKILSDDEMRAQYDSTLGIRSEYSANKTLLRVKKDREEKEYFAQKLAAQERSSKDSRNTNNTQKPIVDINALKHEAQLQKEALAEYIESRERDNIEFRMLSDKSLAFSSISEARQYVDTHPNSRLYRSYQPRQYTPEYEQQTLERIRRRQLP